jgi:protein-tyrosine phosphatase
VLTARRGQPDGQGWPSGSRVDYGGWPQRSVVVRSPHDEHLWLSGVASLATLPEGVDAVVSLCRLGVDDLPPAAVRAQDHVEIWLVDDPRPDRNPHLDHVLTEAVDAIGELRSEGRTVLLHCVKAQSRTPTVAALYGARVTGRPPSACLREIQQVLETAQPNSGMLAALARLS